MKYIIFDLDDTLLNKEHQITEFTLKTLKKLQSLGPDCLRSQAVYEWIQRRRQNHGSHCDEFS